MSSRRPPPRPAPLAPRPSALRASLREDRVDRDRTTRALFPRPVHARGTVYAQAAGTVSGIAVAEAIGRLLGLRVRAGVSDGARVRPGRAVLTIEGDLRRLLAAERTLLNYLMHLSGVATVTAAAVAAARRGRAPPIAVFGTRKTTPGLRDLEKGAIAHGGAHPHRHDLASAVLIKNNHLAFLPVAEAVRRARRSVGPRFPIEVEVRSGADAVQAAREGADAILIDNRSPAQARAIVARLERAGLRDRVWVELSGGITPRTLARYRSTGADAVSLGALTHSAPALPFHLVVHPVASHGPRHSR